MPSWKIQGLDKMAEEVGHNHVTAYVIVELYGFSMELPVAGNESIGASVI